MVYNYFLKLKTEIYAMFKNKPKLIYHKELAYCEAETSFYLMGIHT